MKWSQSFHDVTNWNIMPLDKPRPVTTIRIRNINVHWYMGRTMERGIKGVPLTPGPGFFLGPKCLRMLPVKQLMRPFLSGIRVMKLVLVIIFVVSLTEALFFGNSSNIGGKLTVVGPNEVFFRRLTQLEARNIAPSILWYLGFDRPSYLPFGMGSGFNLGTGSGLDSQWAC